MGELKGARLCGTVSLLDGAGSMLILFDLFSTIPLFGFVALDAPSVAVSTLALAALCPFKLIPFGFVFAALDATLAASSAVSALALAALCPFNLIPFGFALPHLMHLPLQYLHSL